MVSKIGLCVVMMTLAACSSVDISKDYPEAVTGVLSGEYRMGVRDELQISVWRNPELSVSVPIRPDGKVSVPLVGDLVAAGRTSEELAADITKALNEFVRSPVVTVIVSNPASADYLQRVRITGAINAPQSLPFQQGMTVLDVVLQAAQYETVADLEGDADTREDVQVS